MARRRKVEPEAQPAAEPAAPAPVGVSDAVDPSASDDRSFAGMRFEVSLGSSRIQAVQFNTCELGALALEVTVGEGETVQQAYDRAMSVMRACRLSDRDDIIHDHIDEIARAAVLASDRSNRA